MTLDPATAAFIARIAASPYPAIHEGTPEKARKGLRALTVGTGAPPSATSGCDVANADVGGRPGRIYRPNGAGPHPTLVYLHGGGFVMGDLDTHDRTCRHLCTGAETVVVSVDYRLAPEHPFPAAVNDAVAATEWAAHNLHDLGGNAVLAVGGDSAGGNLAAVTAQARPDIVGAQVLVYPATDTYGSYDSRTAFAAGYYLEAETLDWFAAHYLSGAPRPARHDVRHSPLRAPRDVLAGQPRTLITTAAFDPLRDEGEEYGARLEEAGTTVEIQRYEGLVHGFLDMVDASPAAAAAASDLTERVRRLLHGLDH